MEIEIKKTVKAGNSSAVILPRAWLDQEVRVELLKKSPEKILMEVLSMAASHIPLQEIIGVYLAGSYARGEQNEESDIDVLIITQNADKEAIREGIYNILIVSERLLKWKLENDLLPVGPMLKEAKPLINFSYLKLIKIKVTKKNTKWYIKTTKDKLALIERALEKTKGKVDNRVAYSLVLRIRTLEVIKKLISNKEYSKKEFIQTMKGVSGSSNAYDAYLAVKNDREDSPMATKEEARRLYDYLKRQLGEIKRLLKFSNTYL